MLRIHLSIIRFISTCALTAILAGLASCGGGGGGSANEVVAPASVDQYSLGQSLLDQPEATSAKATASALATFNAQLISAPGDGATISGMVNLVVKGTNLANVELLPAQGYAPKLAIFTISEDKTAATAALDTTKFPDGIVVARISAFDTPAGSSTATEIIAMQPRTWNIKNSTKPDPGAFSASIAVAPSDGATISGVITLEVTGSKLSNVELLPTEGYVPKYATFTVSSDGTRATATVDTTKLPDGAMVARISAFDAPAGQPANEIVAMPARTWNVKNAKMPETFSAWVSEVPTHEATISGPVRLVVKGTNLQNVELLPQVGYSPKYVSFNISEDRKTATAILDTTNLSNGRLPVRISAFDAPAGSPTANEIVVILLTWNIQNSSNWTITDLGALGEGGSGANAINDAGEVVGYSFIDSANTVGHGFIYRNGQLVDLGTLGGKSSAAFSVNNAGQVVGWSHLGTSPDYQRPFVYQNGKMVALNVLQGIGSSAAWGINDSGDIVGDYYLPCPGGKYICQNYAFIYKNNVMNDLVTQLGKMAGRARDINNAGQIILNWGEPAYLCYNGVATKIADYAYISLEGINNLGEIVGTNLSWATYAVIYSKGSLTNIGSQLGDISHGLGINDSGQVVGEYDTGGGVYSAFLFSNGHMIDLNSLSAIKAAGWRITSAKGINKFGQIVGNGYNKDGKKRAFLLTPPKNQ